ncbi:hypothetical protein [uncultured Lamprocystis sp.]|jgi:hypothetical protein|uniref:hypothetical protein n=1 Tax=uncultured Lamprocystis sp. TaxID=543132 RepID=UPI0025DC0952|nr:hypothetical protein [uncultured Lamprocystis sp.]
MAKVEPQYHVISLAYHILGLTDGYLDPDGDGFASEGKTIMQARKEAVQAFINGHVDGPGKFKFSFALADNASFLSDQHWYNMKLWNGPAPADCTALVTPVQGTTVNLITSQSSKFVPYMRLRQSGHSSLRDWAGDLVTFIPIRDFQFRSDPALDFSPFTQALVTGFVNATDPRTQVTGTWTGGFKGLSITSANWELELTGWKIGSGLVPPDLSKLTDIAIHMDTIAEY